MSPDPAGQPDLSADWVDGADPDLSADWVDVDPAAAHAPAGSDSNTHPDHATDTAAPNTDTAADGADHASDDETVVDGADGANSQEAAGSGHSGSEDGQYCYLFTVFMMIDIFILLEEGDGQYRHVLR